MTEGRHEFSSIRLILGDTKEVKATYSRSATCQFGTEPLRRFVYVHGYLMAEKNWGNPQLPLGKRALFWVYDVHRSRRDCDNYQELRAVFDDPTFEVRSVWSQFDLVKDDGQLPDLEFIFRAAMLPGKRTWDLEVETKGPNQIQVVGTHSQVELLLVETAAMASMQLEEQTASRFREPEQEDEVVEEGAIRASIRRVVESVTSNLLTSGVIAGGALIVGWLAGRASG